MKIGMIMLYFCAYIWSYGGLVSYVLLTCLCVYVSLEIITNIEL
jgi:hypothetical protein